MGLLIFFFLLFPFRLKPDAFQHPHSISGSELRLD